MSIAHEGQAGGAGPLAPASAAVTGEAAAPRAAAWPRFAGNALLAILARFFTYGLSLPLSVVTARILGPHDKGIYTLILLVTLLFTYCSLGLSSAGIYLVGHRRFTLHEIVANLVSVGLLISALTSAIYLGLGFIAHVSLFTTLPPVYRALVALLGPTLLLTTYLTDCLLAANDIVAYNVANITQVVSQAVGLVAFFVLWRNALGAASLSYAVSLALALACIVFLLARHTRIVVGWNRRLLGEMSRFGFQSYLTSVLNLGNLRLDSFLITLLIGVTAVGYYSVATSLSEVLWQVPLVLGTVLFPTVAGLSAHAGAHMTAGICRRMVLFVAVCVAGTLLASRAFLILAFGSTYLPSLYPLWLLLPGAFGFTVYKTLYSYLLARGQPIVGVISTGAALAVTVALDLLLIPRLGIAGASIASSIAYCLNGSIVLVAFCRAGGVSPREALLATAADLAEMRTYAAGLAWRVITGTTRRTRRSIEEVKSLAAQEPALAAGDALAKSGKWPGRAGLPPEVRDRLARAWQWLSANGPRLGGGLALAGWLAVVVLHLSATVFLVLLIVALAALALSDRLLLGAALLVADITLTDYFPPFAASLSLRTVLGVAAAGAVVLGGLQQRLSLGRLMVHAGVAVTIFLGLATTSNLLVGGDTVTFLRHSFAGVTLMAFLALLIRRARDLVVVLAPVALVAALSALTALAQVFFGSAATVASADALQQYGTRAFGLAQTPITFGNSLAIAGVLLAGVLLYARRPRRLTIGGWCLVGLLVLGAVTSGSRSVLLSMELALAVLALGLTPRARLLTIVLAVALMGGTLKLTAANTQGVLGRTAGDTEISTSQRLVLWQAGLLMVRDHPILGIGYNQYLVEAPLYRDRISARLLADRGTPPVLGRLPPHNDFLTMWLSFGTFAFLAFLWLHLLGLFGAFQVWRRASAPWLRAAALGCLAALAAYCVHAALHNAYDDSLLLWALLGLILALNKLAFAR